MPIRHARFHRHQTAFVFCACAWSLLAGGAVLSADQATEAPGAAQPAEPAAPPVHLIRVPLPITGETDSRVIEMVKQLLAGWQDSPQRPLLILEFRGREKQTGRGSQFERSLSLARYLAGESLSHVRTVAYLSGPVEGHAVLPVLACEEIIAHPDAELGKAGADEPFPDATIRGGYTEIAERRRTVPVPIVMAMLQGQEAVYKLQTLDGVRFAAERELEELKQDTTLRSVDKVIPAGQMANFSGAELRLKLGVASHLARDLGELAAVLRVPVGAIEEDPSLGSGRRGLQVDLSGPLSREKVAWVVNSIGERIEQDRINFVCLMIDSPGGAVAESVRLASYLADLDPAEVRTVAFVGTEARADAALVALACDQLLVTEAATLGGPGARRIHPKQLQDVRIPLQAIAQAKHRDWSLLAAMVDPDLSVRAYKRQGTGELRYFCPAELLEQKHPQDWESGAELNTQAGLRGREVLELRLAKSVVADFGEMRRVYHFEDGLPQARPNWGYAFIEQLASPELAGVLLFVAWFALMIEFMAPGLSGAGFVSGLCFLLFFWAKFLHGTAGWLEVLLFAAGVLCVAVEMFAIPGIGVFGIGGGLLIVASIVLASQTFVLPANAYQWQQLPASLFMVVAAGTGAFGALVFMRRAMTKAPVFKRVSLESPDRQRREQVAYQEALVHLEHLVGQCGVTATQLTPGGKARFGEEFVSVLSEGDVIPAGSEVRVVAVRGNEVLVRTVEIR